MIENLFPTPIGRYKLERDLLSDELSFVQEQKTRPNFSNLTSTNNTILKTKELSQLKSFIEISLLDYFNTVHKPKYKVDINITQSWINYTEKGQHHHKHDHPNSFISGVFYLQANKEKDRIYFFDNKYKQIKLLPSEWNKWNSDSWWFDVGTNDLILFPSHLTHMVQTVETEETRISLSFNTFPTGQIGDVDALTSLTQSSVDIFDKSDAHFNVLESS